MPLPIVAIVGRTNVGKSVLFNRLVGRRVAVVEETPGVTRDRLSAQVELDDQQIILVDTGGLAGAESDELIIQVNQQAARALQEADLLVMVVDAQEGLVSLDHQVADVVRRSGKPCILAANKTENPQVETSEFFELGLGMPVDISALHGKGTGELIEAILSELPETEAEPEPVTGETAVALVGRPNVGKSSIINALLGEERVIVHEEPGTTRDAVDIAVEFAGEPFRLVDTAGLRRAGKRGRGLEYYSSLRTLRALQRADVGLVIMDAAEGITRQDANIAGEVEDAGRGLVIVANKWDLVRQVAGRGEEISEKKAARMERMLRADFERMLRSRLRFADYVQVLFTSAVTGEGLEELLPVARRVAHEYHRRVATGPLNRVVQEAVAAHQPPGRGGRPLKIYYATQVKSGPPTFVIFVNDPKLMHFSYRRYLLNRLRAAFGFEGTPVRLLVRKRESNRGVTVQ